MLRALLLAWAAPPRLSTLPGWTKLVQTKPRDRCRSRGSDFLPGHNNTSTSRSPHRLLRTIHITYLKSWFFTVPRLRCLPSRDHNLYGTADGKVEIPVEIIIDSEHILRVVGFRAPCVAYKHCQSVNNIYKTIQLSNLLKHPGHGGFARKNPYPERLRKGSCSTISEAIQKFRPIKVVDGLELQVEDQHSDEGSKLQVGQLEADTIERSYAKKSVLN